MHRLECAPGTVWDEVQLTCNWPYQVPECSSQVEAHLEEAKVEVTEEVEDEDDDNKVEESTNAKEEVEESTDVDKEEQEEVGEEGKAGQGDLFFSGTWSSHKCRGLRFAPDHVLIDHPIITVSFLSTFDPHIVTVYVHCSHHIL